MLCNLLYHKFNLIVHRFLPSFPFSPRRHFLEALSLALDLVGVLDSELREEEERVPLPPVPVPFWWTEGDGEELPLVLLLLRVLRVLPCEEDEEGSALALGEGRVHGFLGRGSGDAKGELELVDKARFRPYFLGLKKKKPTKIMNLLSY